MDREKLCRNPGSCPQPSELESAGATFVLAAPLRPWRVTGPVNGEQWSCYLFVFDEDGDDVEGDGGDDNDNRLLMKWDTSAVGLETYQCSRNIHRAQCTTLLARREAGLFRCLSHVWNLRTLIWFHLPTCSLVLLPSPVAHSVLSLFLILTQPPAYFAEISWNCFFLDIALLLAGLFLAGGRW